MAIRDKRITNSNGISYTKEVDSVSDHINVTNETYFKDLSDGLIYFKNGSGVVTGIYETSGGGGSDNYTTGTTLDGTTLYFDRTDALSAYTADLSTIGGGGGIGGSGTVDYVARWTPDGNTLGIGSIKDNGSNVRIAPTLAGAPQSDTLVAIQTFNTQVDVTLFAGNTNSGLTGGTGQDGVFSANGVNDLNVGASGYAQSGSDSSIGGYFNVGSNSLPTPTMGYAANFDWGLFVSVDAITPGHTSIGIRSKVSESPVENIAIHGVAGPSFINPGSNHYAAQFEDGTEAIGKVLTSVTANGKANWAYANTFEQVTTLAASYNVTSEYTVFANTTSNSITVNLPAAASSAGRVVVIKKIAAANTVTVDGNGAETIDGAATYPIATLYDKVTVQCDGTQWFIIG